MAIPSEGTGGSAGRYNLESYSACSRDEELGEFRTRAAIGASAPEIALADLDGRPVSLADLRGRYVVLDFGSIT